ncbi:hypothetical protein MMC19_003996 [Ptychographa xylographoides]|nr:hypothetical protein [Ptychographa xylographoides]
MAQESPPAREPVHLDGTTLEGGGQLLRIALSISSLTQIPIHISDIRGRRGPRSQPGKAGGLKAAHLAGAEWLTKATFAETVGLEIKSRNLVFRPTRGEQQSLSTDLKQDNITKDLNNPEPIWKLVHKDGKVIRRDAHIPMSSPGSIFLVLQAVLPYILFSSWEFTAQSNATADCIPVRLTIQGGTNVFHSLSYEYASQVLFHMLHKRLGITPIQMSLQKRGWSMGRADVGSVVFDIVPLPPKHSIPAFSFTDRGDVTKIHVSILASGSPTRSNIRNLVVEQLSRRYPDIEVFFAVDEDSTDSKRLYLLLVAETTNGYRLGRDWLFDEKINLDKLDKTIQKLVTKVVQDLDRELAHGGCVDEYMQDQLVVFQALADGSTIVDGGVGRQPSLHTRTARWVVESLLEARFEKNSCKGIGFKYGGQRSKTDVDISRLVEDLAGLRAI